MDIQVHVGRQGAVTPIAHLKPVEIAGVMVSRAPLHNEDEIKRLGVKIGDTVIVERAGDVIPAIVQVVKGVRPARAREFRMPAFCPVCRKRLVKTEEVILRCVNGKCPARSREYLYFFVSRKAFNIEGLGPKIIDKLFEQGLLSNAPDIFDLKEGDLLPLEHFKETLARKIARAIEASKTIPLGRFLYSLGIRYLGEERALDIAEYFGGIQNFLKDDFNELKKIPDIGDVVANKISQWVKKRENQNYVRELLSKRIQIIAPQKKRGEKLKGLTFVFTGTLHGMTREAAEREVRMQGGEAVSAVSRETSYVVIGENSGSKYEKAKKLGVKVIREEEFFKMLP
jgi:DNA ligase (NAD+)